MQHYVTNVTPQVLFGDSEMFPTQGASKTELVAQGQQNRAWHVVQMVEMSQYMS